MQISRQDKGVRVHGIRLAGVLALLPFALACTSAVRYATGPLPPSALPVPSVRVEIIGLPGQLPIAPPTVIAHTGVVASQELSVAALPDVDIQSRVRRFALQPGPAHGFVLEVDAPKGVLQANVQTFSPVHLDLPEGRSVRIRAFLGDAMLFRLDDAQGPVFLASDGPAPPTESKDLPIEVKPAPRRSYVEVRATDDLCLWTVLQRSVEVTSRGLPLGTVGPGATATFEAQGHRWRVTASEASTPEESDCGREGTNRLAFFWTRLPTTP